MTVAREVWKLKFLRFKNGFILTGFETPDDWKDCISEVEEILSLRDQYAANGAYQTNWTKLVANAGTPLYHKPRVTAYINWKETFEEGFYYYPLMPLIDLGAKCKLSSGRGDTFVQQLIQDLPTELAEEIILKPALDHPVMSGPYLEEVKSRFLKAGLKPKAQFLEFDANKSPHQHLHTGYIEDIVNKDPEAYLSVPHHMCLKTPATEVKDCLTDCAGCGSCFAIDKERKAEGLEIQQPHVKWMHTRQLSTKYDLMDIKATKMKYAPSFFYNFVFHISDEAKLISKENLIRRWLQQAATIDESLITNFRKIRYSFFSRLDYEGLVSNYSGLELCQLGFTEALPEGFLENWVTKANDLCTVVKCISVEPAQDSGLPDYRILVEMDFNLSSEDLSQVIDLFENEEFRIYEGKPSMPEKITFPFDYKVLRTKEGYRLYLLIPPKANPGYTCLAKWSYNKLNSVLKKQVIRGIYAPVEGSSYIDLLTGKPFEVTGFVHVDKENLDIEIEDSDAPEAEGA
jgi:hypothetical protein